MFNLFKVQDSALLQNIFIVSDPNGEGALDIRELLGNLIFWLRGPLGLKFALFFEIFSTVNGGLFVQRDNLAKVVGDALKVFKESFFLSKTTADKMNVSLNGMILFEEFEEYCKTYPPAIDFLCRITLGPYPLSDEMAKSILDYEQQLMIGFSQNQPQPMLALPMPKESFEEKK